MYVLISLNVLRYITRPTATYVDPIHLAAWEGGEGLANLAL